MRSVASAAIVTTASERLLRCCAAGPTADPPDLLYFSLQRTSAPQTLDPEIQRNQYVFCKLHTEIKLEKITQWQGTELRSGKTYIQLST